MATVQLDIFQAVKEALASGAYFITISYVLPDDQLLHHKYVLEGYSNQDILPTLGHLALEVGKELHLEKPAPEPRLELVTHHEEEGWDDSHV